MTEVFFGTNRNAIPRKRPRTFGKRFSDDGLANLRFGRAKVEGGLVSVEVEPERLKQLPGTNLTDMKKSKLGSTKLFDGLRQSMREEGRDTIVFLHGYNVTFESAIQTAAQIAENFSSLNEGRGVNMLAFTWPSDGSLMPWLAYANDRRDAAASGPAFARGILKLLDFLRATPSEKLCRQRMHLVAHSMGNYVLRNALQEVRRQSPSGVPRVFDQIFLMAPDEDDDAFEHDHKLRLLPRLGRRVNVYFNRGDAAMTVGDVTKGHPDRLGDDGPRAPFQVPAKVTQVDCSQVVGGVVEHSYYVDEPKVVADMLQVLAGVDPTAIPQREFLHDRNRFVIQE